MGFLGFFLNVLYSCLSIISLLSVIVIKSLEIQKIDWTCFLGCMEMRYLFV